MSCLRRAARRVTVLRSSCILMASLLGACASTPSRFYTLVPESERSATGRVTSGYRLEVDPVRIPAQVDRLELVTRLPGGGIAIAEGDRWIAPLANELQNALSIALLHNLDAAGSAVTIGSDYLSVRLNVERFESSLNRYALIEASWRLELKQHGKDARVICRTEAYERVEGGYPEIVRGYQRAIAVIADQITAVAQGSAGGAVAQCPVS
jgi:uncharacterized lipoprotein YmbA